MLRDLVSLPISCVRICPPEFFTRALPGLHHPWAIPEPQHPWFHRFSGGGHQKASYWFHPHPHGITGVQVYRRLAGLFLVSDQQEEELNLPAGEFDLPLIIQDRAFDHNNQLQYLDHGMMDRMVGFFGDTILVNGKSEAKQVAANNLIYMNIILTKKRMLCMTGDFMAGACGSAGSLDLLLLLQLSG
jgi:hypothetical protein